MTDEEKPKGDDQETIPKADFDKLKADNERLEKDLEDTRMEVLTPEYQKFLDNLEKVTRGGSRFSSMLLPFLDCSRAHTEIRSKLILR